MLWRINREKSHIRNCSLSQLAGALPQLAPVSSQRCSAAIDFALAAHSNTLSFLCSCFFLTLLSTDADYTPFPSLVLTVCCREGGCTLQLDMSQKLLSQQRTFSPVCIYPNSERKYFSLPALMTLNNLFAEALCVCLSCIAYFILRAFW